MRPDQSADIVQKTLSTIEKGVYTDVSMDLQEYTGCEYFLDKETVKLDTGPDCRFKLKNSNPGNAWQDGLFSTTPSVIAEPDCVEGVTKWFKSGCGFTYDEDEPAFQGGSQGEKILDILETRLHSAMNDYFRMMEPVWWTAGSDSANRSPGVVDYIVKNATSVPAGDFVGGNPAGYAGGVAGISSTTVPEYQNWAGGYSAVTQKDLFHKVRVACAKTFFKPPHAHPEIKRNGKVVIFTTFRVLAEIEEQLENRNDNLGVDAIGYADKAMMRSNKVVWVPYLENNDPTDPLYGVNFAHLYAKINKSVNMKRKGPFQASGNESEKMVVKYRRWYGLACDDRRRQWVISKAA